MLWQAPSNLRNNAGVCPPGGDRDEGAGILSAHILTPETQTSTYYFIAAARQKTRFVCPAPPDDVRARLAELRHLAFEMQDAPMIKAQQHLMEAYPRHTRRPTFLKIDAAPAQAHATLNKLVGEEDAMDSVV
jgi:vanillate O-demethylase monooxygenase subunit